MHAWQLLAAHVDAGRQAQMAREISLEQVIATAPEVLAGRTRGRTIVNLGD